MEEEGKEWAQESLANFIYLLLYVYLCGVGRDDEHMSQCVVESQHGFVMSFSHSTFAWDQGIEFSC